MPQERGPHLGGQSERVVEELIWVRLARRADLASGDGVEESTDKRGGGNMGGAGLGQAATERGAKMFSNKIELNIVYIF